MANVDDTSGKAPQASKKKDTIPHSMPVAGIAGIPGTGMMGASTHQAGLKAGGLSTGTQEWEWLTMSL